MENFEHHFACMWKWKCKLTLCDPMNYPIHGILQTRILEWVAYPFSRGSSWLRNQIRVSCIAGGFFTNWAIREMTAIVQSFEHSLVLHFFGTGLKTDLFQSCGHCLVFQIWWHTEYSMFIASSFRIWNSSAGIPSPPLALLVVMLPKAHLTLHSGMSGEWSYDHNYLSH